MRRWSPIICDYAQPHTLFHRLRTCPHRVHPIPGGTDERLDIARYPDPDGEPVRVEHWVLAERQGQTVARNILGHDVSFALPPFFWSQHYDVPINVTGHLIDWDDVLVSGDPYQRDVLVGYRKAGVIRAVASIYRDRDSLRAEHALATGDQQRQPNSSASARGLPYARIMRVTGVRGRVTCLAGA